MLKSLLALSALMLGGALWFIYLTLNLHSSSSPVVEGEAKPNKSKALGAVSEHIPYEERHIYTAISGQPPRHDDTLGEPPEHPMLKPGPRPR